MRIVQCILLFVLIQFSSIAQSSKDTVTKSSERIFYKPKAILMMLHVSTTLIESYKRKSDEDGVKQVIKHDALLNNGIIDDFSKNFDFCPVYFFYDTEHEQVVNKKLSGVHFFTYVDNKKKEVILEDNFSDYYITEISYPPITNQIELEANQDPRSVDALGGDEGYASHSSMGLNIYYPDFKIVNDMFSRIKASKKWSFSKDALYVAESFNHRLKRKFQSGN